MKEIFRGAEAKIFLIDGEKIDDGFLFKINKEDLKKMLNENIEKELSFKYRKSPVILKVRYKKNYRNEIIDKEFRKYRTRREVKIISRISKYIGVPEIIFFDEDLGIIAMEYIDGKRLSEILEKVNYEEVLYKAGETVGLIHKNKIVHGDLTTSNIILSNYKLYFIDFGLSYFSNRIEDFAVDLHLFKESFESRHWKILDSFESFLEGYKNENLEYKKIVDRLKKIERRGRYKKII